MIEEIKFYILSNKYINNYFDKIDIDNRKDFKQFIWVIIMEYLNNTDKYKIMVDLYMKNELGKYIIGIINNQLISNDSAFYKLYKSKKTVYKEFLPEDVDNEYEEINTQKVYIELIKTLDNIHWHDATLFKLYYGINPITNKPTEPKTYKEIQDLIHINYQSVRFSVLKVKAILKKQIKLYE